MSMNFDTKIAIVIREDLAIWQKLNVTAFITSALVGQSPSIIGENYYDGSGNQYLPMVIQPMMVYVADHAGIRKAYERALNREIQLAIFTEDLFTTGNDIDNRAAVASKKQEELALVGIAMRDDKKAVDKIVKGLKLHA